MRFISGSLILLCFIASCSDNLSNQQSSSAGNMDTSSVKPTFLPVTEFIMGQLADMKNIEVTPLRIVTTNGHADSTWLKETDIKVYAQAFLEPVIDSAHMAQYFKESSFVDQTINAITFTYEPKVQLPDSMTLQKWDVYIDPQTNQVSRVYMVKKKMENGTSITGQLTWKSGEWFKITTIREKNNLPPDITEEQVIWNF